MIRQGFWLVLGATAGVSGYRRASRLARATFPARPGGAAGPGGVPAVALRSRPTEITARRLLAAAVSTGRGAMAGIGFARDVADGMAEYLDRQREQAGRTLDSQRSGQCSGSQQAQAVPGGRRGQIVPGRQH